MKKTKIFIMALLCLLSNNSLFSQEQLVIDTIAPVGDFTINHVFEHINFNEVGSGILMETSLPLIDLKKYSNGQPLTDFNIVNPIQFGLMYGTLLDGTVSSFFNLPDPTTLPELKTLEENDTIPLLFLFANYHLFIQRSLMS